ncbi:MAG: molybdenum cofactor guanylyltransferase MobA [Mesorhizobium sp.]
MSAGPFPAVVLAGGRATRMGGGDKCLLPLAGRPLLSAVLDRLSAQAGPLALNANGDPARFDPFGLPVVADTLSGFAGPLAGVLAAMEWAARTTDAEAVATVAGDTPFFPADLIVRLASGRRTSARIALAASSGRLHPVFGLWPLVLRQDLVRHLAETDDASVRAFAASTGFERVDFPTSTSDLDPFFNVNTPDDLARADAHARQGPRP